MADTEAEAPILWPPDVKNWLTGKDPDAGKDWKREKKGMTEDETVGWHHWLDGHEFKQAPGVSDGQGSLVCCSPWGHKELDMTEWPNWTDWGKTILSSLLSPCDLQSFPPLPLGIGISWLWEQWVLVPLILLVILLPVSIVFILCSGDQYSAELKDWLYVVLWSSLSLWLFLLWTLPYDFLMLLDTQLSLQLLFCWTTSVSPSCSMTRKFSQGCKLGQPDISSLLLLISQRWCSS